MSIPLKIAEGCGREEKSEKLRSLQQGRGNAVDLEYLLLLSRDLHLIQEPVHDKLLHQLIEVRKMLSGFIKAVSSGPL
jgi:four helix bundle protein